MTGSKLNLKETTKSKAIGTTINHRKSITSQYKTLQLKKRISTIASGSWLTTIAENAVVKKKPRRSVMPIQSDNVEIVPGNPLKIHDFCYALFMKFIIFRLVKRITRRSVSIEQSKLVPATITCPATITSNAPKPRKSTANSNSRRSTRQSISNNLLSKVKKPTVVSSPAKPSKPLRKSLLPKQKTLLRRKTMGEPSTTTTKPDDSTVFRNPAAKQSFKCKVCAKTFLLKTNLTAHEKTHNESTNKCKYCDKIFTLKTALSNHILTNCEKISSSQRRKLLISSTATSNASASVHAETRTRSRTTSSESSRSTTPKSSAKKEAHSGIFRTPKKPIRCHTCKIILPDILSFVDHAATHNDNDSN